MSILASCRFCGITAVFLLVFLLVFITTAIPTANADNEQQLEQLKAEISQLKGWLKQAKKEYSDADNALRQSDQEVSNVLRKIEQTQRQLRKEQRQLDTLKKQQRILQNKQSQHQQGLQQQVRNRYQVGQNQALKLWLSQDNPDTVQRTLRYYDYLNQARVSAINVIANDLTRLQNIQLDIVDQQKQLANTEFGLQQQQRQLQQQRQQQKDVIAKLQRDMNSNEQQLQQKTADQLRLKALLAEVRTLVSSSRHKLDEKPFAEMRGRLPVPVKGPVLNAFGQKNPASRSRWQGWQIAANDGQSITAVHHGQVVFADWLRGFGLLLILDHGDDYLTLYAHNQTLFVEPGTWVSQGEVIAEMGRSGGLTDARLYFEIRYQGQPQDPASWVIRKG